MEAVEKISRAYKRDKAVRVLHEATKKNQFRLMPFRQFIRRNTKDRALKEALVSADLSGSIYMFISREADAGEKQAIANETADVIRSMSDQGDVNLLAISLNPQV